jgi:hypothetical protein
VGLSLVAVAVAVGGTALAPAAASSAPGQPGYDGHLEEANAWAVDALDLPAAWETTRGEGATIAVIDTGMGEHPFFEGKDVEPGYSVLPGEEDAWYERAGDLDDPDDKRGHGTGVAAMALLAAPEATILPVRDGTGDPAALNVGLDSEVTYEAIRWAVDNGADVITMAWGFCCTEASEDLYMALQYAVDHDVVLVAGAGNNPDSRTGWHFPAAIPGVVTVSGLGDDGGPWESSTTGPEVDVAGPADYTQTWPNPQGHPHADESVLDDGTGGAGTPLYYETGGTSGATGWIGGVVALVRAAHPDLDADDVIQRLLRTADDRGPEGHDEVFGHGVPDAAAAVGADVEPVDENPLGYPLGIAGASGATATGEPAPGTGAAADGAARPDAGGGSDLVPLAIVALLAAGLAAGGWSWLLRRRPTPPAAPPGPPVPTAVRTGQVVALVVALVVAGGTYVVADAVVDKTAGAAGGEAAAEDAAEDAAEEEVTDPDGTAGSGGTDPSTSADSGAEGELAADGNPAAMAAQAWQDAYTAGDLEAFTSLTCENPWYRVAINVKKLADPAYVRPGFALLVEDEEGWGADDYRLERRSGDKAWVEAGNLSIGSNAEYEIALVREGGWKVCDFWMTGPWWGGVPEWEERWPRDHDDAGLNPVPT